MPVCLVGSTTFPIPDISVSTSIDPYPLHSRIPNPPLLQYYFLIHSHTLLYPPMGTAKHNVMSIFPQTYFSVTTAVHFLFFGLKTMFLFFVTPPSFFSLHSFYRQFRACIYRLQPKVIRIPNSSPSASVISIFY